MKIHIINTGSCGKCQVVLNSLLSELSKHGINNNIQFTDSADVCDLLVIVGVLTKTQTKPLINFWKKMPKSHRVLSIGNCGTDAQDLFNFKGTFKNLAIPKDDLSEIIPVDYVVEGCPPTLEELTGFFQNL